MQATAYNTNSSTDFWWEQKNDKSLINSLWSTYSHLENTQRYRRNNCHILSRLYGNLNTRGVGANRFFYSDALRNDHAKVNGVKSCIDTLWSMLGTNQPRPRPITERGNPKLQAEAQKLYQFLLGEWDRLGIDSLMVQILRDSMIWGTGVVKIVEGADGRIELERVFPYDVYASDVEGLHGAPQTLIHAKTVSKTVLKANCPELNPRLIDAAGYEKDDLYRSDGINDTTRVVESWKLASGEKDEHGKYAKQGRHVVILDNTVILDEPYNEKTFPLVFLYYSRPQYGIFGTGLAEELMGTQIEINEYLLAMRDGLSNWVHPLVFINSHSNVNPEALRQPYGNVVFYDMEKPSVSTAPPFAGELLGVIQMLKQQMYETAGISQMTAGGVKEAGVNAAVAMRERLDQQSQRYTTQGRDYESFACQLGKAIIRQTRTIFAERDEYKTQVRLDNFVGEIDWKDIDLDENAYKLWVLPVSSLPLSMAGRKQMVSEWSAAGWITPVEARELMGFPDVDGADDLLLSGRKAVEKFVDKMLLDREYIQPDPMWDLTYAFLYSQQRYCLEQLRKEPDEELLELLEQFNGEVGSLLNALQAQQQTAAQPAPQGEPMQGTATYANI